MKKKLIMAAAIAFAVFAIPYGSNALSTVSVASENNTVATPAPTPVVDTAKVVENIDKITVDAANPGNVVDALKNQIGTATLKTALEQSIASENDDNNVLGALVDLEAAYANAIGLDKPAIQEFGDDFGDMAIGFAGATFNGATSVYVSVPENKPAVPSSVGAPYYIDFKLKNSSGLVKDGKLDVPVVVDMNVPAGMDANKVVVYHFVDGKVETIAPYVYNDEKWGVSIIFVVDHFSTFAVAEVESTEAASSTESAFQHYRDNMAGEIANAKDGATIKITRDQNINALPNDIMKALYEKKTVALELEYTFEGKEYTVTIPAGKAENNDIAWYGPLYLQMRYGK